MGQQLTYLHYVSCPACSTMFKPKSIPKVANDTIRCICCNQTFFLSESEIYKRNVEQTIKARKRANKKNLPLPSYSKNQTTEEYLKTYKLKSKALFLSLITMPFLILALITSSIYQYKNEIAQDTKWRPYIEQFCTLLNCKLPVYNNLKYIVVEDNTIIPDPGHDNSIKVFAMLNNIGKFDQKYPELKIKFKDINENLIDEKIISPKVYLKKNPNNLLAKNSKQYIDMLLRDPGPDAVNYEISLQ